MPYSRVSFRMTLTLSDLAKHSMTRSIAQLLCDSWASCFVSFLNSAESVTGQHRKFVHNVSCSLYYENFWDFHVAAAPTATPDYTPVIKDYPIGCCGSRTTPSLADGRDQSGLVDSISHLCSRCSLRTAVNGVDDRGWLRSEWRLCSNRPVSSNFIR